MKPLGLAMLSLGIVVAASASAQRGASLSNDLPAVDAAMMLKTAVPDLQKRIARFKPVRMPFDPAGLSANERQMIDQLVAASRALESMYWRQSDPVGLALYKALAPVDTPLARDVRQYLFINGSRWDLVRENEPFVGTTKMPPGRFLYPADLTRATTDSYVAAHPDARAAIFDPFTVVHRNGADLVGRKYHDEFAPFVKEAADALRNAASLSPDQAFAAFLRLRADALLTDDYYASDVAWVDLKNPKVDVIFAPYETYLDDLLGVKTSYGAAVMIRNEPESRTLELYQRWIPDIQEALPLAAEDRPSVRGHATPMEVMDTPFRAGDLRHGYQAVADNLPNDPRIHKEKGTKKIFFKNFMDARVREVILPLATRVMDPAQAKQASAEGYLAGTVLHEICHGLGPAFARKNGTQLDIRQAMAGAFSGLEEAKADVVGMFALKWLVDRGALKKERLEEYYASYVAGIFRTVRFGVGEAHGRAEMMELNYLLSESAITNNGGRYHVEYAKMPDAIARLAKELLEQEATGDRARTEAWFKKYGTMPAALERALDAAREVPIDVDPIVSFDETVK
jgi:Peptidase family M49